MVVPPSPGPRLHPSRMGAIEIADHVWIEARKQYGASLIKRPGQQNQPACVRFLARAASEQRIASWRGGLQGLPMASLHEFPFESLIPILEQPLEQELQRLD